MTERILLGFNQHNEAVYMEKHSWDCDWYWGFGQLTTKTSYTSFKYVAMRHDLHGDRWPDISHTLKQTNITQDEWWIFLDLFKQAYALQAAAEVYRYGGHISGRVDITYLLRNKDKEASLNADLKKVLDLIWENMCKAVKPKMSDEINCKASFDKRTKSGSIVTEDTTT